MRAKRRRLEDSAIGDVMVHAFHVETENWRLRRLVTTMALNISIDLMADDERTLLLEILDGGWH